MNRLSETKESISNSWYKLVSDNKSNDLILKKRLIDIYKRNFPKYAEIVINPNCSNRCKHCIYSRDYHKFNIELGLSTWKKIVKNLYKYLGFRNFIFSGRELNVEILKIVEYTKSAFKDAKVGVIADGPSIERLYSKISKINLDHLDISIDGLKKTHDYQRNFYGSFKKSVKVIKKLISKIGPIKKGYIKKLSILSTLTSINKDEILPMIKYFNKLSLKNFFITPVTINDGIPDNSLKLSFEDTFKFVKNTRNLSSELNDSYISFNIYDDEMISYFKKNHKDFFELLKPKEDYFEFCEKKEENEFSFIFFPQAINGCREFIVNSDANLFTGLVMSKGKIPKENIFANLLNLNIDKKLFFSNLTKKQAFNFYFKLLKTSRSLFQKN